MLLLGRDFLLDEELVARVGLFPGVIAAALGRAETHLALAG